MQQLTVNHELRDLIPPLTAEELAQLEKNLIADGCLSPIVTWGETILDGHNRYAICTRLNIDFATKSPEEELPDLAAAKLWIIRHQLGQRHLTAEQISYLRGMRHEEEKTPKHVIGRKGGTAKQQNKTASNNNTKRAAFTRERLAEEYHVSTTQIANDAAFAIAVNKIAEVSPSAKQAILSRDSVVYKNDVKKLAKIANDSPQTAKRIVETLQHTNKPDEASKIIREAVKEVAALPTPEKESLPTAPIALPLIDDTSQPKRGIETILADNGKEMYILHNPDSKPVFNQTNDMVDWASWTWNPVTGCWHGCDYCYAREIANSARMAEAYPKQFEPTFHPARLAAPGNTKVPSPLKRPQDKNVFTCSMADLFGKWVPDEWIMQVFETVKQHTEWNFLFLTKFPQRLRDICDKLGGFPENSWVGCTVDSQARVLTAERAFEGIKAEVCWLSVEPMNEPLRFNHLEYFDWVVIGGQSASSFNGTPARSPEWQWVKDLTIAAWQSGCKVYWKPNIGVELKEVPWTK